MNELSIVFKCVVKCPLCASTGIERAKLSRSKYYFGKYSIPLPVEGIFLYECTNCSLLYKSAVPEKYELLKIMSFESSDVWRQKSSTGLDISQSILPYINKELPTIIDIGASNGDLLKELKPYASCLSAIDIVEFPLCHSLITKEYIIGNIEEYFEWIGHPYDLITAFDVYEHFIDPDAAVNNINQMINKKNGRLIIETGDWTSIKSDLGAWYYANLFEHQIFWCKNTFNYLCDKYTYELIEYKNVAHKSRLTMGFLQRFLIKATVFTAQFSLVQSIFLALGKGDPLRFGHPSKIDHAFVVLEKTIV